MLTCPCTWFHHDAVNDVLDPVLAQFTRRRPPIRRRCLRSLLFRRGRQRNEPRFKTHMHNVLPVKPFFDVALVVVVVAVC